MAKAPVTLSGSDLLLSVGEELKRQASRPNLNSYVPHEKQIDFHSSPAQTRLYIGGNRSGKSFGNVAECGYWLTKKHPYRRIPVGDYEATRGRINTVDFINGADKILLPLFKQLIPPSFLIDGAWESSYHRASRVLTLNNGSFIEFLSYESDLDKFAGTSRHFVSYDEEPPEVIYTENKARLIDTQGHQWFSMTPVEGMSWVYDTIYLPGKEGKDGFHITEIRMDENPYLSPQAIADFLEGIADDDERLARGEGRFIEMGGLIYKMFDPKPGGKHVIDRTELRFPRNVPIGISLDHGFNNPTAVLWHALLPEGKLVTFHERYISGEVVEQHARAIHKFNRENRINPSILIADPSIRNTDPITGTSILQEYTKFGLPFQLANNDVKAGIERVASYLHGPPSSKREPLWKCTRDCTNLIKEMGRYKWKTYTSKKLNARYNNWEEPHKLNDHACDSLRYFIMSRPQLGEEFANANPKVNPTEFWDDSVTAHTGDWTVRQIRGAEYEQYMSQIGEYTDLTGTDNMGGIW
jgi:phage terminase large subunit-like protein